MPEGSVARGVLGAALGLLLLLPLYLLAMWRQPVERAPADPPEATPAAPAAAPP